MAWTFFGRAFGDLWYVPICFGRVLWIFWACHGCGMVSVECVFGYVLMIFGEGRRRKEKLGDDIPHVGIFPESSA